MSETTRPAPPYTADELEALLPHIIDAYADPADATIVVEFFAERIRSEADADFTLRHIAQVTAVLLRGLVEGVDNPRPEEFYALQLPADACSATRRAAELTTAAVNHDDEASRALAAVTVRDPEFMGNVLQHELALLRVVFEQLRARGVVELPKPGEGS